MTGHTPWRDVRHKRDRELHEHVRQSNLIENVDDPRADFFSEVAWLWLNRQPTLTPDVIKNTHLIVMAGALFGHEQVEDVGRWRQHDVRVGDHICPPWRQVRELMSTWCAELAMELAADRSDPRRTHVEFEKIHPFFDGNGRTGRLLMWWHETHIGRDPTLIRFEDRSSYYTWFH